MWARRLSPVDQAYLIYDHLEGKAKNGIRYRSREEREDHKIFCLFSRNYMVVLNLMLPNRRTSSPEST